MTTRTFSASFSQEQIEKFLKGIMDIERECAHETSKSERQSKIEDYVNQFSAKVSK